VRPTRRRNYTLGETKVTLDENKSGQQQGWRRLSDGFAVIAVAHALLDRV
jgi:hypothetical protein